MTTYRFRLDFRGGDVRKGQIPGAVAQVVLNNYPTREDGAVCISLQCMGPAELEDQIAWLKKELDELEREGKRRFLAYHTRTVKAIDEKQRQ